MNATSECYQIHQLFSCSRTNLPQHYCASRAASNKEIVQGKRSPFVELANLTCALSSTVAGVTQAGAFLLSKVAVYTLNSASNCWTESQYSQSGSFKHSETTRGCFNELILGAMKYFTI